MNLPSRIGRYHVLGRIAYGGMAEILLAKVLGPGGFERPVVIKRVLPHMAAEREFRDMFLDEARIVASIHHPNVVQVHELGREDDELYLVMEYLAGESARSLCARAAARGGRLNLGLCAHIVAEACAGLHAAHEFTGPDGKLLQVVHRDVCPNNLIVTYDGTVKVVDFGIALAADRFTMTDAGQVKGKAGYMAPEQCLGRQIDRRTDVFALGVVLYELTTGHRLFGDALEARVVACLKNEAVPRPSSVVRGYPKELERICLRALNNAPEERFASAEEMRRELVRFQRGRATDLLPEEQLRQCMHDLFDDRIAEKADMLCQLRAGSGTFHIPAAEISDEMTAPVVQTQPLTLAPGVIDAIGPDSSSDATRVPARRRQRGRRRVLLWSGLVALTALLVVAATAFLTEPARGARLATQARVSDSLRTITATSPLPAAREPATVHVEMTSQPSGAMVWIDDVLWGVTPLSVDLMRAERPASLRLELAGHETLEQELAPDVDQHLSLVLRPLGTSRATSSSISGAPQVRAAEKRDAASHGRAEPQSTSSERAPSAAAEKDETPRTADTQSSTRSKTPAKTSPDAPGRVDAASDDDKGSRRKRAEKRSDGNAGDEFFLFD